jgi:hypothetical protein
MQDGQAGRICLLIALHMEYDIMALCRQHAAWTRAVVAAHRCATGEGGETDAYDNRSHL